MRNRWDDAAARAAIEQYGSHGEAVALRVYSSRLIGVEPSLVLHGGGNTSVKGKTRTLLGDEVDCLWVKGSGSSLDKVEPKDFPALDLAYLRRLEALESLSDEEMVNQLRTHLFDASAPNPSVEALLHAFLPHAFVDHSHADAVVAVTNQPNGVELVQQALGDRVTTLPYIMPGFPLAKAVAAAYRAHPQVHGVVLIHHGLFSFGDSARQSYERHIELVDACERFSLIRRKTVSVTTHVPSAEEAGARAARVAPMVRGLLAERTETHEVCKRFVAEWRASDEALAYLEERRAEHVLCSGPLTPDHVIRTKPWPVFVADAPYDRSDEELASCMATAIASYRDQYDRYFQSNVEAKGVSRRKLDSAPRVLFIRGLGVLSFGSTKKDARIAADIADSTLRTKALVDGFGTFTALSDADLFDMEYWSLEQAKLGKAAPRELEGQVALVTGGAGAIGRGIASSLAKAGAHVVLVDNDEESVRDAAKQIDKKHGAGAAHPLVADVTDDASMRAAFDAACVAYGGLDIVVPNAGIAFVKPVAELATADALRVAQVNYLGVLITLREAARVFKAQGTGGNVIVNASKNVFAPGKDFGAYSASKAAAHQLAKVAALEFAALDVRVNQINADAVFAHEGKASGLWEEVGPSRARSRNLTMEQLQGFYRDRNLLRVSVEARHVGEAVLFFASNKTPTTGATLPVDGGIPEAFPR